MVETVRPSMESLLEQCDEEHELVVVDGGSTDGSLEILEAMSDEHELLRLISLDPDPDRALGKDRQIGVEKARGEYVLPQFDADDRYRPVLPDFEDLYHQLEVQLDRAFFLLAGTYTMAPRDLLLEVPYRNLATEEDKDLWRRLIPRDQLIWLENGRGDDAIGYQRTKLQALRDREIAKKIANFQCGITFASCLRWTFEKNILGIHHGFPRDRGPVRRVLKFLFDVATYPYAYLKALGRESFETPEPFRERAEIERAREEIYVPLSEIERRHGIEVDTSGWSPEAREIFCRGERRGAEEPKGV
jgi:glycosyltransferase involved in cell wall biosynthesis